MPKKRITIPKGAKDCQGVECNQNLEFEIDMPETTVTATTIPTPGVTSFTPNSTSAGTPQTVIIQPPISPTEPPKPPEEKKDPHEEMEHSLPSGVNFAKCEGSDCGHKKLKNPAQITKHKACPNCNFNGVPNNNDYCPNCGVEEESKNFEEWEDSDIEIKEEEGE